MIISAHPRTKRTTTISATKLTLKRVCEEIECRVRVSVLRATSSESVSAIRDCRACRFSMHFSQKNFWYGSPVEAAIAVQRILGQSVVLLQWWQNVGCPDKDGDDGRRQHFLGLASRTTGENLHVRADLPRTFVIAIRKRLASALLPNPRASSSVDAQPSLDEDVHSSCSTLALALAQSRRWYKVVLVHILKYRHITSSSSSSLSSFLPRSLLN